MHFERSIVRALLLAAVPAAHAAPTALTVNDSGDAGDGTCTSTCTLRDAISNIAYGGTIDFAQALLPATITLAQGELLIGKSLRIQGPGATQLAISANALSRVLTMAAAPGSVDIVGVTLRDGTVSATNGATGAVATGDDGQPGGSALGGCIKVDSGSLILDRADIRNCVAQGGSGGHGGSGTPGSGLSAGGTGGKGGGGGFALGGGICFQGVGNLTLLDSSLISGQVFAADGGDGGDGGSGFFHGPGGKGGDSGRAAGGAVFFNGGRLSVHNATIAESAAMGGGGGNGGSGDSNLTTSPGGDGGNGYGASGGLVQVSVGDESADFEFATLVNGIVTPGAAGTGGSGAVIGTPGQAGASDGGAILVDQIPYFLPGNATALSSVIVGSSTPMCAGNVATGIGSTNLDEDSSCPGFTLHATFGQLFRPLDLNTPWLAYVPVYHSAVIDAATSCNDLTAQAVAADQHDTPRPQGSACDLGAIEADYIFVDGLD